MTSETMETRISFALERIEYEINKCREHPDLPPSLYKRTEDMMLQVAVIRKELDDGA